MKDKILNYYKENKKNIDKTFFIFITFAGIVFFFKYVFKYVAPFFIGYILSLMLYSVYRTFNEKLRINKKISAVFAIMVSIGVIIGLGALIVIPVRQQFDSFVTNFPTYVDGMNVVLDKLNELFLNIFFLVPDGLRTNFSQLLENAKGAVLEFATVSLKSSSVGIVKNIPGVFIGLFLSFFSCYFFLTDRELIRSKVGKFVPSFVYSQTSKIRLSTLVVLTGYLKAQGILMCISAVIATTGLLLMGYPYAMLVGLAIAVVDALPFFGSGFFLWPWALVSFAIGDYKKALYLLTMYAIIFVTRQLLEPKVLGKQIGIHPLLTLMSVYIGLKVFGVMGLILGPIILVIGKSLYND